MEDLLSYLFNLRMEEAEILPQQRQPRVGIAGRRRRPRGDHVSPLAGEVLHVRWQAVDYSSAGLGQDLVGNGPVAVGDVGLKAG